MLFDVIYYILYSATIIGIFTIALLVYLRKKEAEYKFFAIFAVLIGLWLAVQFLAQLFSDNATLLLRLSVVISPFFAIYFFLFTAQHVERRIKRIMHFILPTIFGCISLFTPLVVESATASISGIALHDGPLYSVVLGFVAVYMLMSFFYIIRENRSKKNLDPSRKQANNIIIIGVLQALVIILFASIFLSQELLAQVLSPFALFLMVLIFSYAIVRHRLFDIRMAAVRTLAYVFSLTTLAGIYSLFVFGLANTLLGAHESLVLQIFYLVVALLLALTFAPLKAFFDKITRSVFYQDAYEPQRVLDIIGNILVSTVNIDALGKNTVDTLAQALKSQYIAILLSGSGTSRSIVSGEALQFKEDEMVMGFSSHKEKVIVRDEIAATGKLSKIMRDSNSAVAARLETHGDFMGYIVFGVKNSGRPYTRSDIDLIHIVADELALGIQNALRFEEIRQFNDTLQLRIEDATKELRKTNEQLQKLDTAKDEFVSMASHQLRTPLTSVKGYISMVLEGDAGKITPMQRQLLDEAFTSSERMVHLIGDFLNVSRLQTGKFMLEEKPVDLAKLVAQEIDSLQTTIDAHGLKLHYRQPAHFPILMIDEGKIRQVLMNFIDNAIFYSQEGTTINVKLSIEEGLAVVRVVDTGIGVPKSEQAHLFTKFFRASNARKQRPDGTGVGLFLAKKVITQHGGTMLFESEEGKGSTFGFRLPIKKLQATEKQIQSSTGNSAYQLKK